jgi:Tfp pilus assembly protein PilN
VLRTNLSTRPFYNERAVHVLLGVAALIILVLTAVNLVEVIQLSRQKTELSAAVGRDRSEAERLTKEAVGIRRGIDQDELLQVVSAAREANLLIDRRTFSWTAFFNQIEATMPPDVMLTSVRPSVEDEGTRLSMVVLSRRSEDVDEFMDKLEATGAFEHIIPRRQEETDEGLHRVEIVAWYVPLSEETASANGGRP